MTSAVFFSLFSFGAQTVLAVAPVCTIKYVDISGITIVQEEKVECPTKDSNIKTPFENDKCYFQKIQGSKNSGIKGPWTPETCPGEIPPPLQRSTPIPSGVYSFTSKSDSVTLTGLLDTAKNPEFKNYRIYFQWAPTPIPGTNIPGAKPFEDFTDTTPPRFEASKTGVGVYTKGMYSITIPNVTPNTTYNLREIIVNDDGKADTTDPRDIKDSTFISDGGIGVGVKQNFDPTKDFEDRSYRLLAPFPGLTVLMDPDLCAEQAAAGNTGHICDLNDFINFALLLLIGLGAALLVVRIIIEGFKYVTSDVPGLKITAKTHIWDAILGLLLVLSAFIILNTINPRLVENTFDVRRLEISVLQDDDNEEYTDTPSGAAPKGVIAACTQGIEEVIVGNARFFSCKSISQKLRMLLTAANDAGIKLSGGGFRTKDKQIQLRIKNCGGEANVYNKNAKCTPPTAVPGTSRHESGLAFDFRCDGQGITSQSNKCFIWLEKNAAAYGLKNYKKEPWHWSVDGR